MYDNGMKTMKSCTVHGRQELFGCDFTTYFWLATSSCFTCQKYKDQHGVLVSNAKHMVIIATLLMGRGVCDFKGLSTNLHVFPAASLLV